MDFLQTTSLLNMPLNATMLWAMIIAVCIISAALIPPARILALKLGYVDQPGGRKIHNAPTPPIGGFVIFTLFLLIHSLLFQFTPQIISLYAALILLLITGLIDDKKPVRASVKFLIHFAAAAIIVLSGGAELENMGNLLGLGEWHLGWFAPIFSIACIVYLINAINMMDGIDGLAGGKSLVILGWLIAAALLHQQFETALHIGLLGATLSGFLFYNMRHPLRDKACIFLGDTGSMALGLIIGWFCIHMAQGENALFQPISIAWIIALPIIDAFGLFVMRIYEGRHPFSPDLRHFHHHFINAGFPVGQSTFIILSLSTALGAIGFCASIFHWPEPLMTAIWIGLWIGHAILVIKSECFVRLLTHIFHLGQRKQP